MAADTANIVIVVIIVIIFFMLMSACCRQLRAAYEEHVSTEELARRRQAFFIAAGVGDERSSEENRSVRVTTISRDGDHVVGVYEIRVPRRPPGSRFFGRSSGAPPPPFHTALQNSSPVYYIDPEAPPPSYEDYIKSHPSPSDPSPQIKTEEKDKF